MIIVMEFDAFPLKRSDNMSAGMNLVSKCNDTRPEIPVIVFGRDCMIKRRHITGTAFTYFTEPETTIISVLETIARGDQPIRSVIEAESLTDLDVLPFPARDLLPDSVASGNTQHRHSLLAPSALLETSRGCMNTCRFCQRHGWRQDFRTHSIGYIVREFEQLRKESVVNVWVADDNFTFIQERAKAVFRALCASSVTKYMKLALSSWTRIDYELCDLAKDAGVSIISFGVESADAAIMDYYGKSVDLAKTRKIVEHCDEIGIYTVGNVIIGAPMETEASLQATFDYVLSTSFDEVNVKILNYMPGAPLYADIPKELRLNESDVFSCAENGLCKFSKIEMKERIENFMRVFRANRAKRLQAKIKRYGTPYALMPGSCMHVGAQQN